MYAPGDGSDGGGHGEAEHVAGCGAVRAEPGADRAWATSASGRRPTPSGRARRPSWPGGCSPPVRPRRSTCTPTSSPSTWPRAPPRPASPTSCATCTSTGSRGWRRRRSRTCSRRRSRRRRRRRRRPTVTAGRRGPRRGGQAGADAPPRAQPRRARALEGQRRLNRRSVRRTGPIGPIDGQDGANICLSRRTFVRRLRGMDLAAAVAPTTLARQRTLPVADPLQPLLPEGGLARGRAVACRGVAATSLTLALAAEATAAGAWLAVVDVPWLGVEAAAELGVPLERLVRVEPATPVMPTAWADLVAAVLDGFELVVTRVPRRVNAAVLRRVQSRIQAREAVLLAVGDPGPLTRRRGDGGVDAGVGGRRGAAPGTCAAAGSPSCRPGGASRGRAAPSCGCPVPGGAVAAAEPRRSSPSRCCAPWADGDALRTAAHRQAGRRPADGHGVVPRLAGRRRRGRRRRARRRAARQPGRGPLAGRGGRGRHHRPAPPPGPAVLPGRHAARPRPRPRRPGVRTRRAGDRPLRPAPRGRRAGLAVPRRPRPVALLRRRRGAGRAARRRGAHGEAGAHAPPASGWASPTGASPRPSPPGGPAGADRRRARRHARRSSPRCPWPGCTSSARSTPSSSACSPASAWPASVTSPRCPRATSWPGSGRPAATPTASPPGSTSARPAGPNRRPSVASSRPSTTRSCSSTRWCSPASTSPTSSSPGWPPRAGCARASS